MDSPLSSQDERDIEVNVVSGASSPDLSPSRSTKSPFYDLKKDKEEKATGSAPYTSFSISSILNRTEPRRESNVLEAALAANHFGSNDAMLSSAHFGLYEVDFKSPERSRTARKSALIYKHAVANIVVDHEYEPDSLNISIDEGH